MRKFLVLAGLIAALAIPAAAAAATLHDDHKGTACPAGSVGVWHFVNNQTDGATGGTLTAIFSTGTIVDSTPDKINKNVMQWFVSTPAGATLNDANTGSVPGKLVLSDFTCEGSKKG